MEPTTLSFTASLPPKAYRDREAHEQEAYYEQITADPHWFDRLRERLAEDLERCFMDQEVELEARLAVINELDAAVGSLRAALGAEPSPGLVRRLGRLIRGG